MESLEKLEKLEKLEEREKKEEIFFDTASGISLEEQEAIFAELDTLTRNRLENENAPFLKEEAKKKGVLLPLLINAAAIAFLAGGFFAFFMSHKQTETQFKAGSVPISITERKLIQEIRNETADKLREKDDEIAVILAKLAEIDGDMRVLDDQFAKKALEKEDELRKQAQKYSSDERDKLNKQNLAASQINEKMRVFDDSQVARLNAELASYKAQLEIEKQTAQKDLQNLRDDYQSRLTILQQERGNLLESARAREANLYKQIETNNALYEQTQSELSSTQEQLRVLSDENEKNTLINKQLEGYYAGVSEQINAGQFQEAASTIASMRDFLNTPSFQNNKQFQAQKASRLAAVNLLSGLIDKNNISLQPAAIQPPLPPVESAETQQKVDSGENKENYENYEKTIAELQKKNNALEKTIGDQQRTITSYQNQGKNLSAQETAINNLKSQVTELQQAVTVGITAINDLKTQNTSLQQSIAGTNTALTELRAQNSALQQTVTARETTVTELRTQVSTLQQTITTREASINELRTQNAALQQTADQLKAQNEAIRQLLNNN
jgi:chromosome segregation ATPase